MTEGERLGMTGKVLRMTEGQGLGMVFVLVIVLPFWKEEGLVL